MINQAYGKSPENPILLNSIPSSRFYLNHLLTSEGYHLVYHRPGSLPNTKFEHPIDHYELMTADGRYDDLYINIYNQTNTWVPPEGYLFSEDIRLYPEGLNDYELEEINEQVLKIEDHYIVFVKPFDDVDDESEDDSKSHSILEMFLCKNYGVNSKVSDFPLSMVLHAIDPEAEPDDWLFTMISGSLKLRE
jgi:hypothetical protein